MLAVDQNKYDEATKDEIKRRRKSDRIRRIISSVTAPLSAYGAYQAAGLVGKKVFPKVIDKVFYDKDRDKPIRLTGVPDIDNAVKVDATNFANRIGKTVSGLGGYIAGHLISGMVADKIVGKPTTEEGIAAAEAYDKLRNRDTLLKSLAMVGGHVGGAFIGGKIGKNKDESADNKSIISDKVPKYLSFASKIKPVNEALTRADKLMYDIDSRKHQAGGTLVGLLAGGLSAGLIYDVAGRVRAGGNGVDPESSRSKAFRKEIANQSLADYAGMAGIIGESIYGNANDKGLLTQASDALRKSEIVNAKIDPKKKYPKDEGDLAYPVDLSNNKALLFLVDKGRKLHPYILDKIVKSSPVRLIDDFTKHIPFTNMDNPTSLYLGTVSSSGASLLAKAILDGKNA